MFRAISTQLQGEIATRFGYTEMDPLTSGPRDVLWCPDDIAYRNRQEQSSQLERDPEQNLPFLSFWRTGFRLNKARMNQPLAQKGAPTSDAYTGKYKMVPVDQAYQIEFWTDDEETLEAAIRSWYKWVAPPQELEVTDDEGIVFQLTQEFGDAQDNSRIGEIHDVGRIHRGTFPLVVLGYVVTSGGTFVTISTVKWNIWDYSAYGTPETAVRLKDVSITS